MLIAQNIPNFLNSPNFWIVFVFMGLSLASWVMGHLREQLRQKRAKDEARRRFEEGLRTGRESEPARAAQPQRGPTMEELAARRQAQLEEIRKRQQRPAPRTQEHDVVVVRFPPQGQPGAGAPGQARQIPGGVVVQRFPQPQPAPTARRPGSSQPTRPPQPSRQQRREVQDPRRRGGPPEQPPARREAESAATPEGRAPIASVATVTHLQSDARTTQRGAAPRARGRDIFFGPSGNAPSRDQLQRLLIAMEVLGKPVALREE